MILALGARGPGFNSQLAPGDSAYSLSLPIFEKQAFQKKYSTIGVMATYLISIQMLRVRFPDGVSVLQNSNLQNV